MAPVRTPLAILCAALAAGCASLFPPEPPLGGTSWRLVSFQGGGGFEDVPDDRSKYTLSFGADGRLSARLDCNRGSAGWKVAPPNMLQITPLAVTRANCPEGSLSDRDITQLPMVRAYVIRRGNLFLMLHDTRGVYEYEPLK